MVWGHWCSHWPAHAITVIAPAEPETAAFDSRQPYRIIRVPYPRRLPKVRMPALWLLLAVRCVRECLRGGVRLVHFQHVFENGFLGPVLRAAGIPYWIHTYAEELVLARRYPFLRQLVSVVLRNASGVTTISNFSRELLGCFGYKGECLLVHPGVNAETFQQPQRLTLPLPEGQRLLTVGRLMERKGHDRTMQALAELATEFPDLRYVIAGVGPEEGRLRRLAQQLGVTDRVDFVGLCSDDQVVALMQTSTIFVHPNRTTATGDVEGFGIVFLEAAAAGLPAVGGRSGGSVDAVKDGVTGFLVDGDNVTELTEKLRELLHSAALRQKFGQAGRELAGHFRWQSAAEKVWRATLPGGPGAQEKPLK